MILRELYYFDRETAEPMDDKRYSSEYDQSIVDFDDTRKTRLSLKQINRIRKANELSVEERVSELDQVRQMYGAAANAQPGGGMI
jgi:hypothetical protein